MVATRTPLCLHALMVLVAVALHPAAQAQTVMKPGGWEMDTRITAVGPDGSSKDMGQHTLKLCLSAEALAKEPYLTAKVDEAKAAARGATCSTSDYQRSGNAASWQMQCELANGTKTVAHISNRASADTLETEIKQNVERGGETGRVTIRGMGRHIGACTPEMSKL